MNVEPYRIFFGLSVLFIAATYWVASPWLMLGFFYALLAGWLWSLAPVWFKSPLPNVTDLLPVGMLLLFMLILCSSPKRSTSEALIYTSAALILFRASIFILVRIRKSKNAVPTVVKAAIIGFAIEMVLNGIQVYSTFRYVSADTLILVHQLSIRVMMGVITLGWFLDQSFTARERRLSALLAVGLYGLPQLAGVMFMLTTLLFLRERKFLYEKEVD